MKAGNNSRQPARCCGPEDRHHRLLHGRRHVAGLQAAIDRNRAEHDADPEPFVGTASANAILERLDRPFEPFECVDALTGKCNV
jgi:hypothetical protein